MLYRCRIHKYASCSNECFVLALIYIDRLIQRNNFLLTELNVHRVVITAILLAAKFFDDAYYNNAYYAKVGGVLVSEMNGLEVDFLFRINFSLHVAPEVYDKYRVELLAQAAFCCVVPQMPSPIVSTCATVPPSPSHQPSSPPVVIQNSPQQMMACNPQAPATNRFPASEQRTSHSAIHETTLAGAHNCSQQITPSPQLSWVQSIDDKCGISSTESFAFPVQCSDGFSQVERSQSYPATNGGTHSHCCAPLAQGPCSAPVIITPAVAVQFPMSTPAALGNHSANVAVVMEHQLFPLQNTLVHHIHHQHRHHHHTYNLPNKPDARARPAMLAAAAGGH